MGAEPAAQLNAIWLLFGLTTTNISYLRSAIAHHKTQCVAAECSGTPGCGPRRYPGATGTKTCWRLAEDAWARHIAIASLGRSTRSIGPTDHVGGSHRAMRVVWRAGGDGVTSWESGGSFFSSRSCPSGACTSSGW